jgi:hypothetical protein
MPLYRRCITFAVAVVSLAACSEQPPTADTPAPQSAALAVPATQATFELSDVWDLCGYDLVNVTGSLHHAVREVIDPDGGMHHWIHIDHYRLMLEGQNTGYVWRYNDTTMRESQWYETATEYGPDSWMYLNEHVRIIGRDGAPSFSANNVIRLTVNANGDLVAYHERLEPLCDGSF